MILNSNMLIRALAGKGDDPITVKLYEKEYVIENISREKTYTDTCSTHLCLNIRDGGDGNLKR